MPTGFIAFGFIILFCFGGGILQGAVNATGPAFAILVGAVIAGVLGSVVVLWVLRKLGRSAYEEATLTCASEGRAGQPISATLNLLTRRSVNPEAVVWKLVCRETAIDRSGTTDSTHTRDLLVAVSRETIDEAWAPGHRAELRWTADVPSEAPFSFSTGDYSVAWFVQVSVPVPGWPDRHLEAVVRARLRAAAHQPVLFDPDPQIWPAAIRAGSGTPLRTLRFIYWLFETARDPLRPRAEDLDSAREAFARFEPPVDHWSHRFRDMIPRQ